MNILDLDKNFIVDDSVKRDDMALFDIKDEPFRIYSVWFNGEQFIRVPEKVSKDTSNAVYELSKCCAGGRVRFVTDSDYIALFVQYSDFRKDLKKNDDGSVTLHGTNMSTSGASSFDVEVDGVLQLNVRPSQDSNRFASRICSFDTKKQRLVTVYFPNYDTVYDVKIGLKDGAFLAKAPDYKFDKPCVYYGSSITQGGCAARAANSYQSIIARDMDINYVNLGFSGNAKGEQSIADYIASLDMSAFVLDYDHNAPSIEHLKNTHENFFKTVRAAHPDLPIVMMPRPKFYLSDDEIVRREIVKTTYENAVASGDKNVYFIDGPTLMSECKEMGLVEGTHPNDAGFLSMAHALEKVLEKIYK